MSNRTTNSASFDREVLRAIKEFGPQLTARTMFAIVKANYRQQVVTSLVRLREDQLIKPYEIGVTGYYLTDKGQQFLAA